MVKPKEVGKYLILKQLGRGGMGTVYKALSPQINKVVAIKLLYPSEVMEITLGYEKLEEIFLAEAQTLASLNHPYLTTVWDYDRDEHDRAFFVMEYYCNNLGEMIGESFEIEKPSRQIIPEKVIHYGVQILDALAFLHHNRVVHRDIKPYNILITDNDQIKVCDFGMALVDGVSFSGPVNMQIGSPCYSPPEQKKDPSTVDARADCYSTAVLLYRMLTGSLPGMQSFPLSMINPVYTEDWDHFFQMGLSWDPDQRFQSADEMRGALDKLPLQSVNNEIETAVQVPLTHALRSNPENRCGARALKAFGLNDLRQPKTYIVNDFEDNNEIVYDRTTDLRWQKEGSPYALNWHEAHDYISFLNTNRYGGLCTWRLPTVDELMSLLHPASTERSRHDDSHRKWLWSSDMHGKSESWYINLDMGYVANQDRDCPNFVKAVSSQS